MGLGYIEEHFEYNLPRLGFDLMWTIHKSVVGIERDWCILVEKFGNKVENMLMLVPDLEIQ